MLNPKQLAFVREYLVDSNATQAALRAGYSAKTACQQGSRLLLNVEISDELTRLRNSATSSSIATYAQVCERMTQILRAGSDADAIKAADRLSKLKGYDQPARMDVTETKTVFVMPPGLPTAGTEFADAG